jgi:hypothetical protein
MGGDHFCALMGAADDFAISNLAYQPFPAIDANMGEILPR